VLKSRIVVSASVSEARRSAAEWLAPVLGTSEVIIVGATRDSADEFARSLPGAGALGVHRFTLIQLAAVIGARGMAEAGVAPVSGLASEAIAARVSDRLCRQRKLPYFGRVARMPGFAGALAATLSDLRLSGVQPSALSKKGPAADDIGRLLRAYEKELKDRALGDLAVLLDTAARAGEHPLLGLPLVFLDAPLESHRHEIFASRLVKGAPAVLAVVDEGDERTLDAYKRLIRRAPDRAEEQDTNALARLRAHVFSNARPPSGEMDASVELFAAPGEGLEAVEIARRIQKFAGEGVPFDEVAILLRGPERYQPFLEEALRRGGIPAHFSRGVARPDPAGRAFLALLACASERCSATRFAEYLSLGEIPALDAEGAPVEQPPVYVPPDDELLSAFGAAPARETEPVGEIGETRATIATPIAWERMLVDAAVVGGRERWARRLRGLEREMELRLALLGPEDEPRRLHLTEELLRLQALERFALPLIDLLGALPHEASWGEWLEQLDRLARSALKHPDTVIAVLNELEPMSDIGPVELEEVTGVLNDRLRFLRREPARRRYGRVFVGSVEEARGRAFQVVFLPGLAEGLFPRKQFEDPLLLDEARRQIALELRTRDDARDHERLLLRTATSSARSRLIVSYPSMDLAQGKARVPSFYALEVARAVEGRVPALRAFETGTRKRASVKLAWPAPEAPADAIDETEFDLAWFEGHRGIEGGAAYLKRNAHLARSLRARFARWERKWHSADGLVHIDTRAREILNGHRLDKRSYSASSLQQFASCPYRFYLHAVAQLRQKEDKAGIEQMDPLTRGALFHQTQFQFFQSVMKKQPESLDATLELLDEALGRVEAKYREDLAPAIERVWQTEIEDMRNDLRGWARHWWADRAEWRTLHAELAFGLAGGSGRDPHSQSEEVVILNGVRVRGAIDLIEKNRHRNALRITDHKTGKAPQQAPAYVGCGAVLQPALYGLAAESMLGVPVESGRLFFCTQRGGFTPVEIPLGDPARRYIAEVLRTIDSAIEAGFLPPAPAHDACRLCDYRIVCGPYEETRAKRKPRDPLEPLNYIRSMP
jgi:ATP-dependent helicase/nuclease subunit B